MLNAFEKWCIILGVQYSKCAYSRLSAFPIDVCDSCMYGDELFCSQHVGGYVFSSLCTVPLSMRDHKLNITETLLTGY